VTDLSIRRPWRRDGTGVSRFDLSCNNTIIRA
jgi:hypothetical protein